VIVLSLLLVLGSAAALVVGLAITDQLLIWVSIGASLCAALALTVAVMRRREPQQVAMSGAKTGESAGLPAVESTAIGRHHVESEPVAAESDAAQKYPDPPDEPPVEDVSAPDALRVVDLLDEVMVVDGRPRYHLSDCRHLLGRDIIPLPIREAREAGFTPCAWCTPDTRLAERARRSAGQ
jgi:hypothetical protein